MTDSPITQSQLDALEKAADRVFAKLGIDIEFTRHFIDRVNDERNRKQITIRELGALLAKEYTRWGNTIAKMPVSAEAVMKDLGSAINMPFVIDKNGNGKDLIAKTIMRKKDFKTPDRAFPVESVEEGKPDPVELRRDNIKKKNISNADLNKIAATSKLIKKQPKKTNEDDGEEYYVAGKSRFYKQMHYLNTDNPSVTLIKRHIKHATAMDKATAEEHAKDWAYHPNGYKIELIPANKGIKEMHGAEKGKQVKGRSATPSMGKPTTGGSSPHPMRGKLVGEQAATEVAQPPLDVTTPSSIAKKHGVDTSMVMKNLKEGFKIEAETTPDKYTAMEIALGHINEMPNYYTKSDNVVASINEMLVKGAWECQQLRERITDPREAMLRKALAYLEEMHEANGDQQSISGYAFDIIRSFNLKNIVNAKELADLYCQWKNVNKDIMC
jgi:hypothetical protein